jgi:hypothetical protein
MSAQVNPIYITIGPKIMKSKVKANLIIQCHLSPNPNGKLLNN